MKREEYTWCIKFSSKKRDYTFKRNWFATKLHHSNYFVSFPSLCGHKYEPLMFLNREDARSVARTLKKKYLKFHDGYRYANKIEVVKVLVKWEEIK